MSDAHICNPNEQLECMRLLTLAGYTFTSDWRLIELQFVLPNEIKDKVGSKEITISEVASLIRASKKEGLHGELSLKLTF